LSQAQANDVESWCTAALLAASCMYMINGCISFSHTGVIVYLCNLEPRVFKLKVTGPGWDDSWQEFAQGTLFIIIT